MKPAVQPEGPGLHNPHGVYVEQIGVTLEGEPLQAFRRVWRRGKLSGRVIDRTPYSADGRTDLRHYRFEAQSWEREDYDPEGVVFLTFMDAVEFLA